MVFLSASTIPSLVRQLINGDGGSVAIRYRECSIESPVSNRQIEPESIAPRRRQVAPTELIPVLFPTLNEAQLVTIIS